MTITSQPGPQIYEDAVTLAAAAARTATGTGTVEAVFPSSIAGVVLTCDLTAAATVAGDKIDVYVQAKVDGTNWLDVCRFAQVLGTSTGIRMYDKIHRDGAVTAFASTDALAAATQRDLFGSAWRARWVLTESTEASTKSFTFSVVAQPM